MNLAAIPLDLFRGTKDRAGRIKVGIGYRFVIVPVLLLAYWLQVRGLADLRMAGDSSYSVYSAIPGLRDITLDRVLDGHPPGYFYLLHAWMLAGGRSELNLRLLSVCFGMGGVASAYILGRRLAGARVAAIAALLVALSPDLLYFDRIIRMYAGLACFALLTTYLLVRLLAAPSWRWAAAYGVASLLAIYNHYFAVPLAAAQAVYWAYLCWRKRGSGRTWLTVYGCLAAAYLPWLAFAVRTQATITAKIISIAPPAHGLTGFVEQLWLPFVAGPNMARQQSLPLALAIAAGVGCAGIVLLRVEPKQLRASMPAAPAVVLAVSLVLIGGLFVVFPAAVRPRQLLVLLPLWLLLLAWVIERLWRLRAAAGIALLLLVLAVDGYGIAATYAIEPQLVEPDAIQLTQLIDRYQQAGDVAVFHAFWEIGYLTSHLHGSGMPAVDLASVDGATPPPSLTAHSRVWLSMYGVGERDPRYPLEGWLDQHWVRVGVWQFGPSRLELFVPPLDPGRLAPLGGTLAAPSGQAAMQLDRAGVSPAAVSPGGAITAPSEWRLLQPAGQRVTMFLHLTDANGRRLAGQDQEPQAGLNPVTSWRVGQPVVVQAGLLVPWDTPPGVYSVEVGAYQTDGGAPLPLAAGLAGPGRGLQVGQITVEPGSPRPAHALQAPLGDGLELAGYDLDLDSYRVAAQRKIDLAAGDAFSAFEPRTAYKPGQDVNLRLYWRKVASGGPDAIVVARLAGGGPIAQQEQTLASGSLGSGATALSSTRLRLPANLPAGSYSLRVGLKGQAEVGLGTIRVAASG